MNFKKKVGVLDTVFQFFHFKKCMCVWFLLATKKTSVQYMQNSLHIHQRTSVSPGHCSRERADKPTLLLLNSQSTE